jgi:tripartite-type tricarboxylate transporter receptor subunit TctC
MKKILTLALTAAVSAGAFAQGFPSKPITLVVPFAAGGPTDLVARQLAEAMRKPLGGATVVVENAAGAGGTIGATKVARATPDGHTLLVWHIGMAATAGLYRKLPYKPLEDFEYLGMINDVPMTLLGSPKLPPTPTATSRTTSAPTAASSTWPTPAWVRPRTCAA